MSSSHESLANMWPPTLASGLSAVGELGLEDLASIRKLDVVSAPVTWC